jgi:hypothetical protein
VTEYTTPFASAALINGNYLHRAGQQLAASEINQSKQRISRLIQKKSTHGEHSTEATQTNRPYYAIGFKIVTYRILGTKLEQKF